MLRVGMHFVTLRVTAICDGRDACSRLESPFRPSAMTLKDQSKAKSQLRFRPDFVGFLRPVTDPGAAATGPECVKTQGKPLL
ncbi:hypothetical protein CVE29_12890 [Pseudomonas syringae pv. actinidiae]|nr:hypothetical protein [Pseudomonas syringae pv. actinidiae]